jgi:hypothetical protein
MGPPADHLPTPFQTRRGTPSSQSAPDESMDMDYPPQLGSHSYPRVPTPQNRWTTTTPPQANPQIRPSVGHGSVPFVSPTRGAAHRLQPPAEGPVIYRPAQIYPGHPYPDYSGQIAPPAFAPLTPSKETTQSSYFPPDHPMSANNSPGPYSRASTPHSRPTSVSPSRTSARYSAVQPSPGREQMYAGNILQSPARSVHTPLGIGGRSNGSSPVPYLGDIPPNQLMRVSPSPSTPLSGTSNNMQNPRPHERERHELHVVVSSPQLYFNLRLTVRNK